ncbi:MAG: hypothetical protein IJS19_06075 [Muribaculaceae bacterium]|nr:hypothetical protein [Muribaculaceae bacterium]
MIIDFFAYSFANLDIFFEMTIVFLRFLAFLSRSRRRNALWIPDFALSGRAGFACRRVADRQADGCYRRVGWSASMSADVSDVTVGGAELGGFGLLRGCFYRKIYLNRPNLTIINQDFAQVEKKKRIKRKK